MTHIGHSGKVLFMRVFLAVLVLILSLQSWTKADDISEFQIEGMSIGDSLLDYVSEDLIIIEKNRPSSYVNEDFFIVEFKSKSLKTSNTNTYTSFQAHVKKNDDLYKIYSLSGMLSFQDKSFNECKKKMKEISNELSEIFGAANKEEDKVRNYTPDPTGGSKSISTYFYLPDGVARIICFDISKELEDKEGWIDSLDIVIYNLEFKKWLKEKAYN